MPPLSAARLEATLTLPSVIRAGPTAAEAIVAALIRPEEPPMTHQADSLGSRAVEALSRHAGRDGAPPARPPLDLPAFVLARLAEEALAATQALEADSMHPWGDRALPRMTAEQWPDAVRGYLGGTWGEHCARQDPTRVLADVAAKRRIVTLYVAAQQEASGRVSPAHLGAGIIGEAVLLVVLRHLAAAWAGHPDYRAEWAVGQ